MVLVLMALTGRCNPSSPNGYVGLKGEKMPLNILPNSGQSLDETRDPIRDNFSYINNGFLVDHVELNSGLNSGKHKAIHLVNQTVAPAAPTTDAGECAIYSAPSLVAPNAPALYIKGQSSLAAADGIEITYALKATPGWTQLPSGIILQWGSFNLFAADAAGTIVVFPKTFGTALNVQLTMNQSVGGQSRVAYVVTGSLITTQFLAAIKNSTSNNRNDGTVYWFAIGY